MKSQSCSFAKSGNFTDVCVMGASNLPLCIQMFVKFTDFVEPHFRDLSRWLSNLAILLFLGTRSSSVNKFSRHGQWSINYFES